MLKCINITILNYLFGAVLHIFLCLEAIKINTTWNRLNYMAEPIRSCVTFKFLKKKKKVFNILKNKVCNKETNEQMHGRNIKLGWDSNQRPHTPKANTITNELKRILPNTVVKYCI